MLRTMVGLGVEMSKHVPGLVNTQVDCHHALNKDKIIKQSQEIVKLYGEAGVPKNRFVCLLPSATLLLLSPSSFYLFDCLLC